jgi:hypothetical protein
MGDARTQLERIFAGLLTLYPGPFRQEFGDEMESVFADALNAAQARGCAAMLRMLARELKHLPGSLLREYRQAWLKEGNYMDQSQHEPLNPTRQSLVPGGVVDKPGWGQAFLAALPYILILVLDGLPKLLVLAGVLDWESQGMQALSIALGISALLVFLCFLVLAWRCKWPLWSASWYLFFAVLVLLPFGWLYSLVIQGSSKILLAEVFTYLFLPLAIAGVLYWVTRLDRLRGLLAGLPVMYFLWLPNMEFVPDTIELPIKAISTAIVVATVMVVVRNGSWRTALLLILGANLVVGLQFAYAGIYHGGSLPFVAPGPSAVEVVKSFIPQYLATCAILLGPLLAVKFRRLGRCSGTAGKIGYHLALLGLLLIFAANLVGLMQGTTADFSNGLLSEQTLKWALYAALGIYGAGLLLLFWAARQAETLPDALETGLMAALPMGIPLALAMPFISWAQPVSPLYGIPLLFVLPEALVLACGLIWLLLCVWFIIRRPEATAPASVLVQAG